MSMLGFDAVGRFALGQLPRAQSQILFSWFAPLSEPARTRLGLAAAKQQFAALAPTPPLVSFSWFEPLAEPVRVRPRSPAALYPNFFWQPAPSPFVATGWFEALSEPARTLPGLRPSQQQFLAYQSNPVTVTPFAWFAPLAEPVRSLLGLKAGEQQFFAAPSQLRPTPTTTGVWLSLETPDVFLGGASVWNRITSGEMGIVPAKGPQAETGVSQTQSVLTAKMSISKV